MIVIVIKLILIAAFIIVFIQDVKDRLVYWLLFPIIGLCCGLLYYNATVKELFLMACAINFGFIFILLLMMYLYAKLKLGSNLKDVFGLGDMLLFFALAFTFSSVSFIVTFVCALIFSLLIHYVVRSNKKHKNVPLAGYMSLFFMMTYLGHWFGFVDSVYSI